MKESKNIRPNSQIRIRVFEENMLLYKHIAISEEISLSELFRKSVNYYISKKYPQFRKNVSENRNENI